MAKSKPNRIQFDHEHWDEAVAAVKALAPTGKGWVNLMPELADEEVTFPRASMSALFGGSGPAIPMGTWVASPGPGKPATIGVEHGMKKRVRALLAEHDLAIAPTWKVTQDNPRRGIVVQVPADEPAENILGWLMGAVDTLCPVQLTGHWLAEAHTG